MLRAVPEKKGLNGRSAFVHCAVPNASFGLLLELHYFQGVDLHYIRHSESNHLPPWSG